MIGVGVAMVMAVIVGVIAGLFVVAAGIFRLGRALAYMPWPVIEASEIEFTGRLLVPV